MLKYLAIALGLLVVAAEAKIFYPGQDFQLCQADSGKSLIEVDIPSCDRIPCVLTKGVNATLVISIIPQHGHPTLDIEVKGIIAGIELPWPGSPPTNACPSLIFGRCPYQAGDWLDYSPTLYVDPTYPSVDVISKWSFSGASEHTCFRIPLQIRN